MFVTVILCLTISFCNFSDGFESDNLHAYMNEPELALIFNVENAESVPEYEVVYLPILQIREAFNQEEEEDLEVSYEFSAFDE